MAPSDRATATPRRAKHHDTPAADRAGAREQLLDAAITLFAERGYDGVSSVQGLEWAGFAAAP